MEGEASSIAVRLLAEEETEAAAGSRAPLRHPVQQSSRRSAQGRVHDVDIPAGDGISSQQLQALVASRKAADLQQLVGGSSGGAQGLLQVLGSHADGLHAANVEAQRHRFGRNVLPEMPLTPLWRHLLRAWLTPLMVGLTLASGLSLGMAAVTKDPGDIAEGSGVLIAVFIVTIAGGVQNWRADRSFAALAASKQDRTVLVTRDGAVQEITVGELVVGDLLAVRVGDVLPADALLIRADEVRVDESSITGESADVKKAPLLLPAAAALLQRAAACEEEHPSHYSVQAQPQQHTSDPHAPTSSIEHMLLLGSSRVTNGAGTAVVLCVGEGSTAGRLFMALATAKPQKTPLQLALAQLVRRLSLYAVVAGVLLAGAIVANYFIHTGGEPVDRGRTARALVFAFTAGLSLAIAAVPEGLPLAVALTLSYAARELNKQQVLVRELDTCETLGSTTVIATDKTGTLTTNSLTVTHLWVGGQLRPAEHIAAAFMTGQHATIGKALAAAVALNSDAELSASHPATDDAAAGKRHHRGLSWGWVGRQKPAAADDSHQQHQQPPKVIGSRLEGSLLQLLQQMGVDYRDLRQHAGRGLASALAAAGAGNDQLGLRDDTASGGEWAYRKPFSSATKMMSTAYQVQLGSPQRAVGVIFVKGAAERVAACCSAFITLEGVIKPLSQETAQAAISDMTTGGLKAVAVAMAVVNHPVDAESTELKGMVLLAVTGIRDPVRPEVPAAVAAMQRARIRLILVTGDSQQTAIRIAREVGIVTPDMAAGCCCSGGEWLEMSFEQRLQRLRAGLTLLWRADPHHKLLLIEALKQTDVVCVTGDGTNDAPALRSAHVGVALGVAGTEIAKQAADLVLLDDSFSALEAALLKGRGVRAALKRFVAFNLTCGFAAVLVTFTSAIVAIASKSAADTELALPLSPLQLIFINLLMDSFAALIIGTEEPSPSLMDLPPPPKDEPLLTRRLLAFVVAAAAVVSSQVLLLALLTPWAQLLLGTPDRGIVYTAAYNQFVWSVLFLLPHARAVEASWRWPRSLIPRTTGARVSVTMLLLIAVIQVLLVQLGGSAFQTVPLNARQWAVTLGGAVVTFALGFFIRASIRGACKR